MCAIAKDQEIECKRERPMGVILLTQEGTELQCLFLLRLDD